MGPRRSGAGNDPRRGKYDVKTLIIIPAYNEEKNIERVVDRLDREFPQYDYVIINDGSRDDTAAVCRSHGYNMVNQAVNLGLAGAFRTGMKYALRHGYDAAIQLDGDGQHKPEYIAEMESKVAEGYDIVIGSRFVNQKKPMSLRMAGSNLIQFFIRLTTGKNITDPTSGMRMFGPRMIHTLAREINYGPEPDTIAHLIRSGAEVCETPVTMNERTAGKSYLTMTRAVQYMATMCVSIVFVQWFRKKTKLTKQEATVS
jgi:glycosyltransferase involved in cell wall biosynthesis